MRNSLDGNKALITSNELERIVYPYPKRLVYSAVDWKALFSIKISLIGVA